MLFLLVFVDEILAASAWLQRLTANAKSRNSPGFDPNILRGSVTMEFWGAADEALLN